MNKFAQIISVIFHPAILIIFLPFFIIYGQTLNIVYAFKWQIISSCFVFFVGVMVWVGEKRGIFSDADLSKRKERGKFYSIVGIILTAYIILVVVLEGILSTPVIIGFGGLLTILIFSFFNHIFKISVHSGAAAAFASTLGILYGFYVFMIVVWVLPLVIWARLVLKKHTLGEALSGSLIGGIITIVTYFVGRSLMF